MHRLTLCAVIGLLVCPSLDVMGQGKKAPNKKPPATFRWVNSFPQGKYTGLKHATYASERVKQSVGYCVYLPPGYDSADELDRRYPVVYYLHGGRPGGETKSIALTPYIDAAIRSGDVPPMIYVFVNGGAVSHYNYPQKDSPAEDMFVHELIPHVDATYRTIAAREGRGLEGFSQGGRATARIGFGFPHLFCSAASGGGGHATEKHISENDGWENTTLRFLEGANTWDRARKYAASPHPPMHWLFYVGSAGFNYRNNLEYMEFLDGLGIPYQRMIVSDVPHNTRLIYELHAKNIMGFHADNFVFAGPMREKAKGVGPKREQEKLTLEVAQTLKDITYGHEGGKDLKLDLYLPKRRETPLVLWIHGGGWRGGSKNNCPIRWLTAHGYAVASLEFRSSGDALFPAAVHDCKGAIRWLRAHQDDYGYDSKRIGLMGGSSGGHLAALIGVTGGVASLEGTSGGNLEMSSRVQAVVDMYGMTDLLYNATVEKERCDLDDCPLYQWMGGKPSEHLEMVKMASPLFHVSPDDPALLILHGDEDRSLVRPFQGRVLFDAYASARLDAEFQLIRGAGHGGPAFFDETRRAMILQLFARSLR
jgi:acetyl esterase/lipase/enterochelin esterase-like enzyme